jgi:hypothetical protein
MTPKSLDDYWETNLFTNSLTSGIKRKNLCSVYEASVVANPKLPADKKDDDKDKNTFFCHPFHDIMFESRKDKQEEEK